MSGEGFLGRWSRRKLATPVVLPSPPVPEVAPAPPEPAFDPATLPPVDTLTAASEIRDFLRAGVPTALRQAALRRVWALDPAIAEFIGPADYAWDFNAPDGMAGFAPSMTGDVGRMLARAIGLDAEPAAAAEPVAPDVAAEAAPVRLADAAPVVDAPEPMPDDPPGDPLPPPRRHGGALPV